MSPEQLQAEADALAQKAIEMGSNQGVFQQALEDAVNQRLNYNQDLINSRSGLLEEQLALPSVLRAELAQGAILNPLDREAIIGQRRASTGARLAGVMDSLDARKLRIADFIGRGTTQYGAESDQARMLAQLAQDRASRALAARQAAQQLAMQQAAIDAQNRWYEQQNTPEVVVDTGDGDTFGGKYWWYQGKTGSSPSQGASALLGTGDPIAAKAAAGTPPTSTMGRFTNLLTNFGTRAIAQPKAQPTQPLPTVVTNPLLRDKSSRGLF